MLYYYARGSAEVCPLDAELRLPRRCYADLLREWMAYDATDGAYRETTPTLERILGLGRSFQSRERVVSDAACDVAAFSDQLPSTPAPVPLGTMVVAQAAGKGVPMVPPPRKTTPVRLGSCHGSHPIFRRASRAGPGHGSTRQPATWVPRRGSARRLCECWTSCAGSKPAGR